MKIVGTKAKDFELMDQMGGRVLLSDHLKRGPVLLVFYRGHWCPYCRRYLCKLKQFEKQLRENGVGLLAICPEPRETSSHLHHQLNLSYPLLSDSDGVVMEAFGTRNRLTSGGNYLPHPAVFLIDRDGTIRFGSIDRDFKKRTTMRTIRQEVDRLMSGEAA
jgi:peroxiredoxin